MAFVAPGGAANPLLSRRADFHSTSCPIRLSTFVPSAKSFRLSPLWPDVLQKTPPHPLVVTTPALATLKVDASPPKILISGAPASGKGTQCEYIVDKYRVVHISTGDMLRAAVNAQTPLGVEAKSYMDTGRLVPDELVISMLKERITKDDCAQQGWLLDGFPRTAVQAQALSDANIVPSAVIVLDVEDDALIERVIGRRSDPVTGKIYHTKFNPPSDPEVAARLTQRSDDTEEKARVRLENYYTHAKSIEDHYSSMVKKIDGNRTKSDVFKDISNIIDIAIGQKNDDKGDSSSTQPPAPDGTSAASPVGSTKSMPVAEFVKRAEEAYEIGVLKNDQVNWSGQATAESSDSAGTSTYGDLVRRLDLAIGDSAALLAFAYIGRAKHGDSSIDLGLIKTAAPFIVAWLGVTPLLGAYTRNATANASETTKNFVRSWAIAIPMGIALRGVVTDHVPPASFAVVSLISTFVIMGSWRLAYVKIRGNESDEARKGGIFDGFQMLTTLLRRW